MSLIGTCILCQTRLPFESGNTWILVRHLLDKHPLEIMSLANNPNTSHRNSGHRSLLTTPKTNQNNEHQQQKKQKAKPEQCPLNSTKPKSRHVIRQATVYRTTVAQWKPAQFRVKCSECGERFYPTIRTAASRTSNALGAACILSCWPFCFLPALFTNPTKHHLHCSNCNAYLGLYDARRDCAVMG